MNKPNAINLSSVLGIWLPSISCFARFAAADYTTLLFYRVQKYRSNLLLTLTCYL